MSALRESACSLCNDSHRLQGTSEANLGQCRGNCLGTRPSAIIGTSPLGTVNMTTKIKLSLPDKLASEAQEAGLLTSQAIEQLLREAVRRKAVDKLVQKMDEPADATFPPMTLEEIQAEVDAVHAQGRKRAPHP